MESNAPSAIDQRGGKWQWLRNIVGIDPRSLASCRIAVGLLLLVDLLLRLPDLEAMNTDAGIMPIEPIQKIGYTP